MHIVSSDIYVNWINFGETSFLNVQKFSFLLLLQVKGGLSLTVPIFMHCTPMTTRSAGFLLCICTLCSPVYGHVLHHSPAGAPRRSGMFLLYIEMRIKTRT